MKMELCTFVILKTAVLKCFTKVNMNIVYVNLKNNSALYSGRKLYSSAVPVER